MTGARLPGPRPGGDQRASSGSSPTRSWRELQLHCYRCSGRCRTPRTCCRRRWWPLGVASTPSRGGLDAVWLYRITTNRCLNTLRDAGAAAQACHHRWPLRAHTPGRADLAQPYPGELLEGIADTSPGPEARTRPGRRSSSRSSWAARGLPPRQRAALALARRARLPGRGGRRDARDQRGLRRRAPCSAPGDPAGAAARRRPRAAPRPGSAAERELIRRFADAVEATRRRGGRAPDRRRSGRDAPRTSTRGAAAIAAFQPAAARLPAPVRVVAPGPTPSPRSAATSRMGGRRPPRPGWWCSASTATGSRPSPASSTWWPRTASASSDAARLLGDRRRPGP